MSYPVTITITPRAPPLTKHDAHQIPAVNDIIMSFNELCFSKLELISGYSQVSLEKDDKVKKKKKKIAEVSFYSELVHFTELSF